MKGPSMGRSYRWVMLSLAFLTAVTLHLTIFSLSPLLSMIISELKLSHFEAGATFSAMVLSLLLMRPFWGFFTDRFGLVSTMKVSSLLIGVSGILRGLSPDYISLLTSQLLTGVGLGATVPCLPKIVSAWFPSGKRGLPTGLYVAGFPVGSMAALSLTPLLLRHLLGWRNVFQLYGLWGLTLTVLWWALGRESEFAPPSPKRPVNELLRKVLGMKSTWVLAGLMLVSMGIYDTLTAWLPYTLVSAGVSLDLSSSVTQMLPLGFLTSSLTVGALLDKAGRVKPLILIFGILSGFSIYAITLASLETLAIFTFLVGFCEMALLTIVLKVPTELEEATGLEGGVTGVISSIANIGPTLFPILVGYIKDATDSFFLAFLALAFIAETTPILGVFLRERRLT